MNESKIAEWYKVQCTKDDLVISASPDFLLVPICKKLGARLIASRVCSKSGRFIGDNCFGEEKVRRFFIEYQDVVINKFYTDSDADLPLAKISKTAFKVNNNAIKEWII